jgi:hypothetical protein
MRSASACVFCADLPSSSGSQYLKTMVEATTEHLRLTVSSLVVRSIHTNSWHMQHTTTIEASKSSQQLPPQSYLKVIQRTHHREKYTLLPQKSTVACLQASLTP